MTRARETADIVLDTEISRYQELGLMPIAAVKWLSGGGIRTSFNVISVIKDSTGTYTVNVDLVASVTGDDVTIATTATGNSTVTSAPYDDAVTLKIKRVDTGADVDGAGSLVIMRGQ